LILAALEKISSKELVCAGYFGLQFFAEKKEFFVSH